MRCHVSLVGAQLQDGFYMILYHDSIVEFTSICFVLIVVVTMDINQASEMTKNRLQPGFTLEIVFVVLKKYYMG